MEKNYKYRMTFGHIQKHEVVKETPKQIHFLTRSGSVIRSPKTASFFSWHDTFEDAKNQMIKNSEERIAILKDTLSYEERHLLRFRELKEEQD